MPALTKTQAAVAGERTDLATKASRAQQSRAERVGANYGVSADTVLSILSEYGRLEDMAPKPPTPPTPQRTSDVVTTVHRHLVAVEALSRLLPPETAEEASSALEATKEATTRWGEVRETRAAG